MEPMLPFLSEEHTRMLRQDADRLRRARGSARLGRWHLRRTRR
jgi:hypothetical protein